MVFVSQGTPKVRFRRRNRAQNLARKSQTATKKAECSSRRAASASVCVGMCNFLASSQSVAAHAAKWRSTRTIKRRRVDLEATLVYVRGEHNKLRTVRLSERIARTLISIG